MNTKAINGFQLKIIGLVLMVFDHIYEFFAYTNHIPIAFKWVGRLVAPIFIFMVVEGYTHTRNKGKYMARLFIGSLLMSFANTMVVQAFPRPDSIAIINDIFGTMFVITVYMFIIEFIQKSIQKKNILGVIAGILGLILPFIPAAGLLYAVNAGQFNLLKVIAFIPNPLFCEGGIAFVALGILFYLFRKSRNKQLIAYVLFSAALAMNGSHDLDALLFQNYQWMMIFAAPLLFLYNGQKGRGMKYLFYIFYPAHIYVLYVASYFLLKIQHYNSQG